MPLEDNVVLYKTVDGVRSPLDIVGRKGGYGTDVKVLANAWLGTLAQAGFGEWRRRLEGSAYSEFPRGDVGFPKGDSPEVFLANMMTFLKEAAATFENPAPPPVFNPAC
jgi:hypothetical protein